MMNTKDPFDYSDWSKEDLEALQAPFTAKELEIKATRDWCHQDQETLQRYGGHIVVAFGKEILGAGKSFEEALENAEPRRIERGLKSEDVVLAYIPALWG